MCSARKRADEAHKLAIDKEEAAGHEPFAINADGVSDLQAMPSSHLPTDAAGKPKAGVQKNFTFQDSKILNGPEVWIQATRTRPLLTVITR